MTAPPLSIAERGTSPTDRPSGSSGHVLGEDPRYGICAASLPGAEGRSEASQIQRGHCEDNVGVQAEAFNSPTPQGKVIPSPTRSQRVSCARAEDETDRDFDAFVAHQWREHLRGLSPEVAEEKRWKSGYWWNWHSELVFTVDDIHVEGSIPENDFILEKKFVSFDLDDYQRSLGGYHPPTD